MRRIFPRGGVTLCVALCFPAAVWAQDRPSTPSPNVEPLPAARTSMHAQGQVASDTAGVRGLSLRQAIEVALTHNPDLATAVLEVGASEGVRQQAGAYPNPEISWLQEDTQRATRTTTLQLNQSIELGGKRTARAMPPTTWPSSATS